jgi:lipoic acid synthetase
MSDKELFEIAPKVKRSRLPQLPQNPEAASQSAAVGLGRFPSWLHRKLPEGRGLIETDKILKDQRVPTVCEEAKCPNLLECWSRKTATFLTLGSQCTRNCGFCSIDFSTHPKAPETDEPDRIADSVKALGLKHVVLTMVARDDLPDGGAAHLVEIVSQIRKENRHATIELLTSDFAGNEEAWQTILESHPEVFNHNIETVRRLSPRVRHKATYERTLRFLKFLSQSEIRTIVKSGLMVGLGETEDEVQETLRDLKNAGCQSVTIGQYLQPTSQKLLVKEFITPAQFEKYKVYGESIGIPYIFSGPFVRSSYHADSLDLTKLVC